MIGLYLSPIYILVHLFMLCWLIRWLKNVSSVFRHRTVIAVVTILYLLFFMSVGIGFLAPQGTIYERFFKQMGNYALGISLYELMTLLVFAIVRFIRRHRRFADLEKLDAPRHIALWGLVAVVIIGSISAYGIYQAHHIVRTDYQITIKKDGGRFSSMNIVLASDLHMGFNAGTDHISAMVDQINAAHPDVVVFAGDLFDNEYRALDHPQKLIASFRRIKSRYGVYGVYGNHDVEEKILGGFTFNQSHHRHPSTAMRTFLKRAGIKMLSDQKVLIDHSVYLYGRKDAMTAKPEGVNKMMRGINENKPVIVLEHEPYGLDALSHAGADLTLAGHTHNGQLFPANIIVSALWENSYGYRRFGDMHAIVTSGVGAWGPFMRVGSKAEICKINIRFQ